MGLKLSDLKGTAEANPNLDHDGMDVHDEAPAVTSAASVAHERKPERREDPRAAVEAESKPTVIEIPSFAHGYVPPEMSGGAPGTIDVKGFFTRFLDYKTRRVANALDEMPFFAQQAAAAMREYRALLSSRELVREPREGQSLAEVNAHLTKDVLLADPVIVSATRRVHERIAQFAQRAEVVRLDAPDSAYPNEMLAAAAKTMTAWATYVHSNDLPKLSLGDLEASGPERKVERLEDSSVQRDGKQAPVQSQSYLDYARQPNVLDALVQWTRDMVQAIKEMLSAVANALRSDPPKHENPGRAWAPASP